MEMVHSPCLYSCQPGQLMPGDPVAPLHHVQHLDSLVVMTVPLISV